MRVLNPRHRRRLLDKVTGSDDKARFVCHFHRKPWHCLESPASTWFILKNTWASIEIHLVIKLFNLNKFELVEPYYDTFKCLVLIFLDLHLTMIGHHHLAFAFIMCLENGRMLTLATPSWNEIYLAFCFSLKILLKVRHCTINGVSSYCMDNTSDLSDRQR